MFRFLPIVSVVCILSLQACGSDESKKESTKESSQHKNFSEATFLDITPLADGGAYAYDVGGALWYLRGTEAVKVKEVSQLSTQPTSLLSTKRERALWALLQHERSKRKSAESERDNYSDNSDYSERDEY
jgi:hypothetical protein